jgi:putative oxidoreductase
VGRPPEGIDMNGLAGGAKSLLRIVAALLFLQHGGQKLLGWFGGFPGGHLDTLMLVAGCIELIGGALLLLGLLTRPVAFLASGEMAVAYFKAHFPHGVWPLENHGESPVLYCFLWLYFAASGPGPWSLDALIARARHRSRPHPSSHEEPLPART